MSLPACLEFEDRDGSFSAARVGRWLGAWSKKVMAEASQTHHKAGRGSRHNYACLLPQASPVSTHLAARGSAVPGSAVRNRSQILLPQQPKLLRALRALFRHLSSQFYVCQAGKHAICCKLLDPTEHLGAFSMFTLGDPIAALLPTVSGRILHSVWTGSASLIRPVSLDNPEISEAPPVWRLKVGCKCFLFQTTLGTSRNNGNMDSTRRAFPHTGKHINVLPPP